MVSFDSFNISHIKRLHFEKAVQNSAVLQFKLTASFGLEREGDASEIKLDEAILLCHILSN